MNPNTSPFRQMVTPPEGQRLLEQVNIPAQTKRGQPTIIGLYIESAGPGMVRLLITNGLELIWTERVLGRDHEVAARAALSGANDALISERFQKERDFKLLPLAQPQLTPAFESELARI